MAKYDKPIQKFKPFLDKWQKIAPELGTTKLAKRILADDEDFYNQYSTDLPSFKNLGAIINKYRKRLLDGTISMGAETDLFNNVDRLVTDNDNLGKDTTLNTEVHPNDGDEHVDYDSTIDDTFELRSVTEKIRFDDESNLIKHYSYTIKQKDDADLVGILTREEMQNIYMLYTRTEGGANLTAQQVSRTLPNITLGKFRKILSTFKIRKDSMPYAPHVLEEHTEEQIIEIINEQRELNVLRKLDHDSNNFYKKSYKKALEEIQTIKGDHEYIKKSISKLIKDEFKDIKPIRIEKVETANDKALNLYLADWHIGAFIGRNSLYKNDWNVEQMYKRLNQTIKEIGDMVQEYGVFDTINVCSLGDMVDGQDGKTTRGLSGGSSHVLPQNQDSRQQFNNFVMMIKTLVDSLHDNKFANNINLYLVPDSNHGGILEYSASCTIREYCSLKYPNMETIVYEQFLNYFKYGKHTFILSHGKDEQFMRVGLPYIINDKYEGLLNNYLDSKDIYGKNVHVIKGDLHRSATQKVKRFRYRNVCSGYGSSEWIMMNFGEGYSGCDYEIVSKNKDRVLEGHIVFNRE